jgi:erythromycin esterase-like protein
MKGYPAGEQLTPADWSEMFDAVMFLRKMRPATSA